MVYIKTSNIISSKLLHEHFIVLGNFMGLNAIEKLNLHLQIVYNRNSNRLYTYLLLAFNYLL